MSSTFPISHRCLLMLRNGPAERELALRNIRDCKAFSYVSQDEIQQAEKNFSAKAQQLSQSLSLPSLAIIEYSRRHIGPTRMQQMIHYRVTKPSKYFRRHIVCGLYCPTITSKTICKLKSRPSPHRNLMIKKLPEELFRNCFRLKIVKYRGQFTPTTFNFPPRNKTFSLVAKCAEKFRLKHTTQLNISIRVKLLRQRIMKSHE